MGYVVNYIRHNIKGVVLTGFNGIIQRYNARLGRCYEGGSFVRNRVVYMVHCTITVRDGQVSDCILHCADTV